MPLFKTDTALRAKYGNAVQFATIRLPQAFDQWIEAKRQLEADNPDMPKLGAGDDSIGILTNSRAEPMGFVAHTEDGWYTTNEAHRLTLSSQVLIPAAFRKARADEQKARK